MTDAINEESARWVARSDAGLSPTEKQELEAWLAADSRHRGAYARSMGYWIRLDRFAALNGPRDRDVVVPRGYVTRRQAFTAAAAALGAMAIGSFLLLMQHKQPKAAPGQSYSAGIGELKRVVLSDSSVMLLNTSSKALVRFDSRERIVQLLSGEALFQVAPDRTRPFVVEARSVAVKAIGTEFSVKLASSHIDLTVTEGAVQLGHSESGAGAAANALTRLATVSALHQATITGAAEPQIRAIDQAEVSRELAWRQGMVWFDGQTLEVAVAEINRYNRRKIIVDDLALAAKPVIGVFSIDDLDGFAAAAGVVLQADVVADGDVIRLERKLAEKPSDSNAE